LEQESRHTRNRIVTELLELAIRELFDWGLVQTDPNFANYRYEHESGRIGLLDFGASRHYPRNRTRVLQRLLTAAIKRDTIAIAQAASDAGYLQPDDPQSYREAVTALLLDAAEPARYQGEYDFSNSKLAGRMSEKVMAMRLRARYWRLPPPDLLFLHRKLGGMYMLCARLRTQIHVRGLIEPYLIE
jgi:predicted unusual protein kinase regulating ubiquinone biosynthesis (AarF/ABC1/UbiB family)